MMNSSFGIKSVTLRRLAIVIVGLALLIAAALSRGSGSAADAPPAPATATASPAATAPAANFTLSGPVNAAGLPSANGGHIACPNGQPCGPDNPTVNPSGSAGIK